MKKALVVTFVLVLGLGVLASAQSFSCTGDWEVTFAYSPFLHNDGCSHFNNEIFGLSSSLELNLSAAGWLFSSVSGFDSGLGFNSQAFSAAGSLGAVSLSAEMEFLPNAVTKQDQWWWWAYLPYIYWPVLYNNPGDACDDDATVADTMCKVSVLNAMNGCPASIWHDAEFGPAFKDFTFTGSINLAGVNLEGLFLMNAWAGTVKEKDVFLWDVCSEIPIPLAPGVAEGFLDYYGFEEEPTNLYWAHVVQSGSNVIVPVNVSYWGTATSGGDDPTGTGFRFTLGGTAGGMDFTSYTYFNLTESDAKADTDSGCPVLGKKGDYAVAGGCGFAFTEEYFMVEGIPLCCDTTIDAALKLVCPAVTTSLTCVCTDDEYKVQTGAYTVYFPDAGDCTSTTKTVGFEYLQFLVKDIPFIPGFYDLTASIKFTTGDKEFSLCGQPSFGLDTCFSMTLLANWEEDKAHNGIANKFTGIDIKDLSFTCECAPGVVVTFTDVLYDLETNALKSLASTDNVIRFLVPLDADSVSPGIPDLQNPALRTDPCPPVVPDQTDDYNDILVEYWDTPKYKYYAWESLSIDIEGDACCGGAFAITIDNYIGKKYEADPKFCGCICDTGEDEMYYVEDGTKVFYNRDVYKCTWSKDPNYTEIGPLNSLFSWMATDVSVTLGLFSNFDITIISEVSFRGWEKFGLTFGFIW